VTNYERIKAMSVDEMALMFHALCKGVDDKWTDALNSAGVVFDSFSLADENKLLAYEKGD
jgi:hypothetical protein